MEEAVSQADIGEISLLTLIGTMGEGCLNLRCIALGFFFMPLQNCLVPTWVQIDLLKHEQRCWCSISVRGSMCSK